MFKDTNFLMSYISVTCPLPVLFVVLLLVKVKIVLAKVIVRSGVTLVNNLLKILSSLKYV